jgi:hypothetical protein
LTCRVDAGGDFPTHSSSLPSLKKEMRAAASESNKLDISNVLRDDDDNLLMMSGGGGGFFPAPEHDFDESDVDLAGICAWLEASSYDEEENNNGMRSSSTFSAFSEKTITTTTTTIATLSPNKRPADELVHAGNIGGDGGSGTGRDTKKQKKERQMKTTTPTEIPQRLFPDSGSDDGGMGSLGDDLLMTSGGGGGGGHLLDDWAAHFPVAAGVSKQTTSSEEDEDEEREGGDEGEEGEEGEEGASKEAKKEIRLKRNRASAALSRQRKRLELVDLRQRCRELERANAHFQYVAQCAQAENLRLRAAGAGAAGGVLSNPRLSPPCPCTRVGTFHIILQLSKHRLMTPRILVVHVTERTLGSDNPSRRSWSCPPTAASPSPRRHPRLPKRRADTPQELLPTRCADPHDVRPHDDAAANAAAAAAAVTAVAVAAARDRDDEDEDDEQQRNLHNFHRHHQHRHRQHHRQHQQHLR